MVQSSTRAIYFPKMTPMTTARLSTRENSIRLWHPEESAMSAWIPSMEHCSSASQGPKRDQADKALGLGLQLVALRGLLLHKSCHRLGDIAGCVSMLGGLTCNCFSNAARVRKFCFEVSIFAGGRPWSSCHEFSCHGHQSRSHSARF